MKLERTLAQTETFAYGDYRVDMTATSKSFGAWIYRKDYGIKELMFEIPRTQNGKRISPDEFLEIVENELSDAIGIYEEEMDDTEPHSFF